MFISQAFAQDAAGSAAGGGLAGLLPLVLIFVVFYFLMIRPQQKRMKEHRAMLDNLRRGDRVVTSGGLIGTVSKVINEDEVTIEIGDDNKIKVRVRRGMIAENMTQAAAAATEKAKAADKPAKDGAGKDDKAKSGGQKAKKENSAKSDSEERSSEEETSGESSPATKTDG